MYKQISYKSIFLNEEFNMLCKNVMQGKLIAVAYTLRTY